MAKATPDLEVVADEGGKASKRARKVFSKDVPEFSTSARTKSSHAKRISTADVAANARSAAAATVEEYESGSWDRLNDTQKAALLDADAHAATLSSNAHVQLVARLQTLGYSETDLNTALDFIRDRAPVTINFNPDMATATAGKTVLDAFLEGDLYKNQFETQITGGSNTAYPGGARDNWEKTIFRGDYHTHPLISEERPKYGALSAQLNPSGGANAYGTSYFVLKQGVKNRTTFTPVNSSGAQADDVGTAVHFEHLLANPRLSDQKLKGIMDVALGRSHGQIVDRNYIEAQIHGTVDFEKDIAKLVANLQFKGNEVYEPKLRAFAQKHHLPIEWTNGIAVYDDATPLTGYTFPGLPSKAFGPTVPPGYTAVKYGSSVAFVPAEAGAVKPSSPPVGYIAYEHPAAGTIYLPQSMTSEGKPTMPFGSTAYGMPAPLVTIGAGAST